MAALIGIPYSLSCPGIPPSHTNIHGTLNVLEAAWKLRTKRLLVTSTSEVYGTALFTPITEEHPLQGQSPYSATKIGADMLAQSYFRSFDLPVVTLRPFNTYGPRQSARAFIPTVLSQKISGFADIRVGNLEPKRDLTFVEDTARAFVLAAEATGLEGETIHFGQGEAVSMDEVARRCLKVSGGSGRLISGQLRSSQERQRPKKSEVELLLCDPAKARRLLNWSPRISSTMDWWRTWPIISARIPKNIDPRTTPYELPPENQSRSRDRPARRDPGGRQGRAPPAFHGELPEAARAAGRHAGDRGPDAPADQLRHHRYHADAGSSGRVDQGLLPAPKRTGAQTHALASVDEEKPTGTAGRSPSFRA